jgi:hypothetical protein
MLASRAVNLTISWSCESSREYSLKFLYLTMLCVFTVCINDPQLYCLWFAVFGWLIIKLAIMHMIHASRLFTGLTYQVWFLWYLGRYFSNIFPIFLNVKWLTIRKEIEEK